MCRRRLTDRADVVLFPFYGEQSCAPDGARFNPTVLICQCPGWQCMLLKYEPYSFEIKLGGQIQHCEVFIVKCFRLRGLCRFAVRKIFIEFVVRLDMAIDIHAHEGSELYKPRIHLSATAAVTVGDACDQVSLKPIDRFRFCELVDLGWIDPRVDGAGHERHRAGLRRTIGLRHDTRRYQRCNAWLANGYDMSLRSDRFDETDQVRDILIKSKTSAFWCNVACIMPIRDKDVVLGQHCADGCAK